MSHKRVYKNTLYLYVRMFVMMLISLYSSRMVLRLLGSSDYGLFNVVGGFTAFFFFISNSLSLATERYMAYAMGQKDTMMRKKVFTLSLTIFCILATVILVVALAVGIPFVRYQLNIPSGREDAAVLVYIFALLSAIFSFVRIPFNASVIAYERMGFFAWISIVESLLKLLLLFLLYTIDYDKLVMYALMLMGMSLTITLVYAGYCHHHFHDLTRTPVFDKTLLKSMGAYTGWNLYGGIADLAILQGLAIVLNWFFGTIVNAAQAIADQIKTQIAGFVNNLNTASSPAITKHYAEGDTEGVRTLLFQVSKLNYFLLLAVSAPIIVALPAILDLWLGRGIYPEKTVLLTRLVLVNTLIDTIPGAVQSVMFATGRMKHYQLCISGFKFLSILTVCLVLALFPVPEYAYYTLILFALPRVVVQISICCNTIRLSQKSFYSNVVIRDLTVTVLVAALALLTTHFSTLYSLPQPLSSILSLLLSALIVAAGTLAILYFIGLTPTERKRIVEKVKTRKKKS